METFTTQDLINELLELKPTPPTRREGGVTVIELARAKGIAKNTAREILDGLVRTGYLTCEYNITPECNRPLKVYYKAENRKSDE